jgi:hypothetical protein
VIDVIMITSPGSTGADRPPSVFVESGPRRMPGLHATTNAVPGATPGAAAHPE